MSKSIVFLSHIADEAEVAIAFKELIERAFLGLIDVFVSSDTNSIPMGAKWLESVTENLKVCAVEIILCSPRSVTRPWINFEAGAGWIRGIEVIPLCHSGMTPSDLPVPLRLLQGTQATDDAGLQRILPVLAKALGAAVPAVSFDDFISKTRAFEGRYTFWADCNASFARLAKIDKALVPTLKRTPRLRVEMNDAQIAECTAACGFLQTNSVLRFSARVGDVTMSPNGTFYTCVFEPMSRFAEVMSSSEFRQ